MTAQLVSETRYTDQHALFSRDASILADIIQPGTNLCVWQRQPGNGLIHRSPEVPAGDARLLVTLDLC